MSKIMSIILSILSAITILLPFGNPISNYVVTKNSEIYIAEKYADTDYVVEQATYDFKTGNYYVHIKSPSSPDSGFTVYSDTRGNIGYDTYEDAVLKKGNTAGRIDEAYRRAVEQMLSSGKIPYTLDFGFGEIIFKQSDAAVGEDIPPYAISTEALVLDAEYDTAEMGRKAGKLTIYFYDKNVTAEKLAEILLCIRKTADESGVTFKAVNCVLQYKSADNTPTDNIISVSDFLYVDIYEEGLVERVKANIN